MLRLRWGTMCRAMALVAAAEAMGACGNGVDDCLCERPLNITVTPRTVSMAVGDTASVEVSATVDGNAVRLFARWESSAPAIVVIDTATGVQSQVRVPRARMRGVTAGEAALVLSVTSDGRQITMSVPVTVRPRS